MIKNRMKSYIDLASKIPDSDIYSGNEQIRFYDRHPIYKTLMKLEFEETLREFVKKKNSK